MTSEERRRRTRDLRGQIASLRNQIADFERELKELEDSCQHKSLSQNCLFSAPKYEPIVIKGYTIPADPPGTMGVDRIPFDQHVPDRVIPQWTRVCSICGKVEATESFEEQTVAKRTPRF